MQWNECAIKSCIALWGDNRDSAAGDIVAGHSGGARPITTTASYVLVMCTCPRLEIAKNDVTINIQETSIW